MKLYIEGERLRQCAEEMLVYAKTIRCMCEDISRLADDMTEMSSVSPVTESLKEAAGRLEHRSAVFCQISGLLQSVCDCYQKAEEEISGNSCHKAGSSVEETDFWQIWQADHLPEPVLCAALPPICLEHPEWLHFV